MVRKVCFPLVLRANERLAAVGRDYHSKSDQAYIVTDRFNEYVVMSQSLPLLAKWINSNVTCAEAWDRVTHTGLFENIDRIDGRNGGFHKGRWRIKRVPLKASRRVFESERARGYGQAVVVASMPGSYDTERIDTHGHRLV